jgi:23S rRNA maturation mini-RNase III
MARKSLQTISDSLEDLATQYIEKKKEENSIKKITSDLNTKIKDIMSESDLTSVETSLGTLTLTYKKSESFDEEKLIDYLKSSGNDKEIVKTKEYIDYDALESAIYHERLSNEQLKEMDKFKIVKTTPTLNTPRK